MRDIADYAELSAQAKATYQGHNHRQAGDPAKLGTALVELAAAAAPPLRYAAGSDAVDAILGSLAERQDEIERWRALSVATDGNFAAAARSEEHTSELKSLMRTSYAVFCLKKHTCHNIRSIVLIECTL